MEPERLHWGRADVRWDGATFSLVIPTTVSGAPVRWLNRYLEARIKQMPGFHGDERALVTPAELHEPGDPSAGVRVWGQIELSGLIPPPWPDAAELRRNLEAAVTEAVETSEKAAAEGDWFTAQLQGHEPAR